MTQELPKRYEPQEAEKKWQEYWQKNNTYVFTQDDRPNYTVDTPPPTVSGKMHLGHAFSYSQQDYVVRYHRMKGENVFFPFGSDDNGLPTERLVEKEKKVRSTNMQREEFRKLCLDFVNEHKPTFIQDWIDIGMSCDFSSTYSTIDEESQYVGQKSFVDLHKKGLLQREETPVTWCTKCKTAIAQADFENIDLTSHFNEIIFKTNNKELIIATTRPELIPACVALCYHPSDERYQELKNKHATVPITGHEVPILADEAVDKEKGTGLMMVCTFGDKEDIEKWHKHKLPLRIIFTDDGKIVEEVKEYAGLTIRDARKKILEDLQEKGLLVSQKKIVHAVNVHDRCATEVEFLKKPQWYIKVLDKKQELLEAGNKINWYPKHMQTRYNHWVENLGWDWCISRQRHYGVPFPVWYKKDGTIVVAQEDELPIDPTNNKPKGYEDEELTPETDVMDTWMISSVSPQIALTWREQTPKNYPMSLRPQAHDIIRTWAFYTIVKGIYHHNTIPWKNIMISGHVLDPKGKKMSKSVGNVVDPKKVIQEYGADAMRYWAAGVKLGDDLPYMEKDLATGKKTINKLFNASKFTLMHLEGFTGYAGELEIIDKWLLSKLQKIIKEATESFEQYEYSKTRFLVDQFFWNRFCDQYLELVKGRIYNEDLPEAKASAQYALHETLRAILKMFAPIMPHITEEIYQLYYAQKEDKNSIHISAWPEYDEALIDEGAEQVGDIIIKVVDAVRKFKSENKMSLKDPIKQLIVTSEIDISKAEADLISVTRAQEFIHEKGDFEVKIIKE